MKSFGLNVYHVTFESNHGASGTGSLVVTNGRISGCDSGYSYRGYVKVVGGCMRGKLIVTRTDPAATSIFGSIDQFVLLVAGNTASGKWTYSGQVLGAEQMKVRFDLKCIHY